MRVVPTTLGVWIVCVRHFGVVGSAGELVGQIRDYNKEAIMSFYALSWALKRKMTVHIFYLDLRQTQA